MNAIIEKELLKFKTHLIDYATIKTILQNIGYVNVNNKISKLKQEGVLKSIKKELYVHNSLINNNIISKEIIANNILGPSYISLDYALYYYGLIPETVHHITSITTKRSKKFETECGDFTFKQITKSLFQIGLRIEETKNGNFIISSKEKAICDKIYFTKDLKINSQKSLIEFLENDLRIDIDDLVDFNVEILKRYYEISKSKKIKLLLNLINYLRFKYKSNFKQICFCNFNERKNRKLKY